MEGLCEDYAAWKHCITVKCGLKLTPEFVDKRIAALSNKREAMTARFIELYGDEYRQETLGWFEQARTELGNDS